ncbi:MAG: hypothetical protein IJ546_00070 [Prevotella sp.]|nr:hypothetical protein [Prevotella sp.]
MKKAFLTLLLGMATGVLTAQTSRPQLLQNAKNLIISMTGNRTYHYLVTTEQTRMMHRREGKVIIGRDTLNVADIKGMRFRALPRFALSEDSTEVSADYSIDHGLLALRRGMNLNKWNTLVLPFAMTGTQVRETFGQDAMLAYARGITEDDVATVEFVTIPLDTEETVIEAGNHYLIRPTKEPDVKVGEMTSVAYGNVRIGGPVYLIPNVSMASGQQMPDNPALRSDKDQVRMRIKGTYVKQDLTPTSRDIYLMNDDGRYAQIHETTTLKAFRSWIEVLRNNDQLPLRFYIDGIAEDITQGISELMAGASDDDAPYYDLQGRKVNPRSTLHTPHSTLHHSHSPQILIHNGKKIIVR